LQLLSNSEGQLYLFPQTQLKVKTGKIKSKYFYQIFNIFFSSSDIMSVEQYAILGLEKTIKAEALRKFYDNY